MAQNEGLRTYQQRKREEMKKCIDEAINEMRTAKITITKTSLAEELGVSRQALNADYISKYLTRFGEFNKFFDSAPEDTEAIQEEMRLLKLKMKEMAVHNRELKTEIAKLKEKNSEMNEKYERLLGHYQHDVGAKVIPF